MHGTRPQATPKGAAAIPDVDRLYHVGSSMRQRALLRRHLFGLLTDALEEYRGEVPLAKRGQHHRDQLACRQWGGVQPRESSVLPGDARHASCSLCSRTARLPRRPRSKTCTTAKQWQQRHLPAFSGRAATSAAASTAAPLLMPHSRPSSSASRRAISTASSELTCTQRRGGGEGGREGVSLWKGGMIGADL